MIRRYQGRRRATTLVELMVTVGIFATLTILLTPTIVFYARSAKGIAATQKMQREASMLLQVMASDLVEANEIELINGTSIRIKIPRYLSDGSIGDLRMRDLRYTDGDSNPETIGDNSLVYLEMDASDNSVIRELFRIDYVSAPDSTTNPFSEGRVEVGGSVRFIDVSLRLGDRSRTPSEENNRWTGPGFQGMLLRYALTPKNQRIT